MSLSPAVHIALAEDALRRAIERKETLRLRFEAAQAAVLDAAYKMAEAREDYSASYGAIREARRALDALKPTGVHA